MTRYAHPPGRPEGRAKYFRILSSTARVQNDKQNSPGGRACRCEENNTYQGKYQETKGEEALIDKYGECNHPE
ncbi:hypothetical protein RTE01_45350 [Raoultella terrigena]|nr:hypothetical protein RTE01_45350 [Raoultella terrigena]